MARVYKLFRLLRLIRFVGLFTRIQVGNWESVTDAHSILV